MTPLHLRPTTLDEIVFEGRNKAYGAFDLRQAYPTHMRRAFGISLALFALLAASPMIVHKLWPTPVVSNKPIFDEPITPVVLPPDAKPVEPVKPIAQPVAVKPVSTVAVPTHIKPDELVKPQPQDITPPADALPGPTNSIGEGEVPIDGAITTGKTGTGDSGTATAPAKPEPIFTYAEKMPEFAGGQEALAKYLRKNMRYPARALREGLEGKVFVAFTVSSTGEIVDVEVIKGLGFGTDEEAQRVISQMPRWQPGQQNGRAVSVRYTLPITFKYSN